MNALRAMNYFRRFFAKVSSPHKQFRRCRGALDAISGLFKRALRELETTRTELNARAEAHQMHKVRERGLVGAHSRESNASTLAGGISCSGKPERRIETCIRNEIALQFVHGIRGSVRERALNQCPPAVARRSGISSANAGLHSRSMPARGQSGIPRTFSWHFIAGKGYPS